MSRLFTRLSLACVAACSAAIPSTSAWAQDDDSSKPTVVVAIAPLQKILKDLGYVTRASGVPEAGGLATTFIRAYSGGVDDKRPAGFAMTLDENSQPITVAFIPLTDREAFFEPLGSLGEIDDLGEGLYAMNIGPQSVYAQEEGDWLFVAQQEEHLESVMDDPSAIIGKLADRYDLAIKVDVESIPDTLKDMLISQMKDGYERAMEQQAANQSEEERAIAEATGAQSMAQLEQMVRETSDMVIGWAVDQSTKKTYIDIGTQYVEGSEMEKQIAGMGKESTKFAAFQSDEAASSTRFTSVVSEKDVAQATQALDAIFNNMVKELDKKPETKEIAEPVKKFVAAVKEQTLATLKEGVVDGGVVVDLEDGMEIVGGGRVADGGKLAAAVKELFSKMPSAEGPKIKFDAYKHAGVTFHTGSATLPSDADDQAKKIFGEEVKFVVGTADKAVYFALGKNCEANLKSTIDKNATAKLDTTTPMEFHVELAQVLAFASKSKPIQSSTSWSRS